MPKRKRTQAFTAPKDKQPENSVQENANASSLLLSLPAEIREEIWKLVLGNRIVHISFITKDSNDANNIIAQRELPYHHHAEGHLTHHICHAGLSPDEAYQQSKLTEQEIAQLTSASGAARHSGGDAPPLHDRHHACYPRAVGKDQGASFYSSNSTSISALASASASASSSSSTSSPLETRLSLQGLQVCRQMHSELSRVLWTTTTWTLSHPLAFYDFLDHRNASQRKLLRRLHLDIAATYDDLRKRQWSGGWWANRRVIFRFPAIETLHLEVTSSDNLYVFTQGLERKRFWHLVAEDTFDIADLRLLPLKHVTVVCTYVQKRSRWFDDSKDLELQREESMKVAEKMRMRLLDHRRQRISRKKGGE